MRQKSLALSFILFLSLIGRAHYAHAEPSLGSGVLVRSPLAVAVQFNTSTGAGYALIAFHESPDVARVVLTQDLGAGSAPIDDVVVPASSLTLSWDRIEELWKVTLKTSLPTLGELDVYVASPWGFDSNLGFGGCGGFYEFVSPTGGLNRWGNLYGEVNGATVQDSICLSWGTDISGIYTNPPVSL